MKPEMCWVDLETTGLDAISDVPLELGIVLTDNDGRLFDQNSWLISEQSAEWKIKVGRGASHEIVGPMHEKSGLWDDLVEKRDMALTRKQLDDEIVNWLKARDVVPGTLPMVGASIGSLDRPFVITHFPKFNEYLHYRNIDISTLKELCKRHNPDLYSKMTLPEATQHRVLNDIHGSILEYNFYLENFLFVPGGKWD